MKGSSTGRAPIQVNISINDTSDQNINLFIGRNEIDLFISEFNLGIKQKMATEANKANTPPNLLGILRKIA